ncbi:MAG UNVERIFIED_CONTAM: hypothetical protein LVR18_32090 [Planctomycetaceae bacterium]
MTSVPDTFARQSTGRLILSGLFAACTALFMAGILQAPLQAQDGMAAPAAEAPAAEAPAAPAADGAAAPAAGAAPATDAPAGSRSFLAYTARRLRPVLGPRVPAHVIHSRGPHHDERPPGPPRNALASRLRRRIRSQAQRQGFPGGLRIRQS